MAIDAPAPHKTRRPLENVVIRFAGDSGDGMQLTGGQFTEHLGARSATTSRPSPTSPPRSARRAGTTFGVSGFQVQFASTDIYTPGDSVNALVAMNPAALKTNIARRRARRDRHRQRGRVHEGQPQEVRLHGGYNPLEDDELHRRYRMYRVPMSRLTRESLAELAAWAPRTSTAAATCTRWAWCTGCSTARSIRRSSYLNDYFGAKKQAGDRGAQHRGPQGRLLLRRDRRDSSPVSYQVAPGRSDAGHVPQDQRQRGDGAWACRRGRTKASKRAVLRELSDHAGVGHAALSCAAQELRRQARSRRKTRSPPICAAIGASLRRRPRASPAHRGPGIALKSEAMGLAVMLELPLVIVDVQRAGPATGMPTKTEQADLLQAMCGRNERVAR